MRGDFTRNTFSALNHFTRVLSQQGRVQLDADFNEQTAILLHLLRSLAADLIGQHGGPAGDNLGFKVGSPTKDDFTLTAGHYYVDGLLCENEEAVPYSKLPGAIPLVAPQAGVNNYLVYLDAWEQHISYLQDGSLREPALNGPDTATRARLVTLVRVSDKLPGADGQPPDPIVDPETIAKNFEDPLVHPNLWERFVETLQPENRGLLAAKAQPDKQTDPELCLASPDAGYRGMENQLYRVEIHRAGLGWDMKKDRPKAATFKWSRENGSVVFPVYKLESDTALIEKPLDDRLGLHVGEWVEVLGDLEELYRCMGDGDTPYHCHGVLAEVSAIQPDSDSTRMQVRLNRPDGGKITPIGPDDQPNHPLLRRWDHRPIAADTPADDQQALLHDGDGALLVREGVWLDLEYGVKIFFNPPPNNSSPHQYRSGDYWLIPARTAVEDVLWPLEKGNPKPLPPHGVEHHYAPLAFFPATPGVAGAVPAAVVPLQHIIKSMAEVIP